MASVGLFIDAIGVKTSRDSESLIREAVPLAVRYAFKTGWRLLLRVTSDHALVTRTPLFYSRSRNVGRLEANVVSPGVARFACGT